MRITTIERECDYCGSLLVWNRLDKSFKPTGSWYEKILDILHDMERCQQVREGRITEADYERGYRLQKNMRDPRENLREVFEI